MVRVEQFPQKTLEKWLQQIVDDPLTEQEVSGPEMPDHLDPETGARLESDGVPAWWPKVEPENRQPLSPAQRKTTFHDWIGGELTANQTLLLNGGPRLQRQAIAQSLLLIHAALLAGDATIRDLL